MTKDYIKEFCPTFINGLNNLGLHEVLNYILREEEKLVLDYSKPPRTASTSKALLLSSSLTTQETLLDVFLTPALAL